MRYLARLLDVSVYKRFFMYICTFFHFLQVLKSNFQSVSLLIAKLASIKTTRNAKQEQHIKSNEWSWRDQLWIFPRPSRIQKLHLHSLWSGNDKIYKCLITKRYTPRPRPHIFNSCEQPPCIWDGRRHVAIYKCSIAVPFEICKVLSNCSMPVFTQR